MKKKIMIIGIILLVLTGFYPLGTFPGSSADWKTYYVDDDYTSGSGGWGVIHFNTIQWAIDTINRNDPDIWTIHVYPGTYTENIKINTTLRLRGENKNTTFINGNDGLAGIEIYGVSSSGADNVDVSGFTIQHAVYGLYLHYNPFPTSYNTISNCIITDCDIGMFFNYSDHNTIQRTTITNCGQGMFLNIYASSNQLTRNIIGFCNTGLLLDNDSLSNTITDNIFSKNHVGIQIGNSYSAWTNSIYHNDFLNTTNENAYDPFKNFWDDGNLGNHWSDFDEPSEGAWDNNSNGVVDYSYLIPGGNVDNFPSVEPFLDLPLTITAAGSIPENQMFQVTVSSIQEPVEGVTVIFNSESKTTNAEGQVTFTAPSVVRNSVYSITVSKPGYQQSTVSITVVDSSSPPTEPQLVIQAPSSVLAEASFLVTITADQAPISSVGVVFIGAEYATNASGQVTLIAPHVVDDTTYTITASKSGYQSASGSIIVRNDQSGPGPAENTTSGWIYGWVTDTVGEAVSNVSVCVLSSSETIACTSTDAAGDYDIVVPPGLYLLKATKQDYVTSIIYDVLVQENRGEKINFTIKSQPLTVNEQYPVDYALRWGTETGAVLGQIDVLPAEKNLTTLITTYSEHVGISIQHANQTSLSFSISGPDGAVGKIVAIRFGSGTLTDMENVTVLYDNTSIAFVTFDEIFHRSSENNMNTTAQWTSVIALDKNKQEILYVLIWIPHFSEHHIIIYSPAQIIENLWAIAIIIYVATLCILAVVIAVPLIRLWRKIE